jgi:hypothetical protein
MKPGTLADSRLGNIVKLFLLLCLLLSLFLAFLLQTDLLDKRYIRRNVIPECPWCDSGPKANDVVYVPVSSSFVRLLAPADPLLLADFLWMLTAYYFGQHALTDHEYPYLLYLLDLLTDLDPGWKYPYLFGAVVLPTEAESAGEGFYLIDKGLAHNPDTWELWFYKGYYLWKVRDDLAGASGSFHKAAMLPGSPKYLPRLAATFATRAGRKELARRFLEETMSNIKDPSQREIILEKLKDISNG